MQHKMILFYRKKSGVNKLSKLSHDPMMEMFIFETAQLLEQLEEIIINSEKSNSYSAHNINEIFRIMHTIKGSSAMMLYNNISTLAHSMEDLFFFLRETKPSSVNFSELTDLILKGADFIKTELVKIEEGMEANTDSGFLIDEISKFLADLKKANSSIQNCEKEEKSDSKEKQKYYIRSDKFADMSTTKAFKAVIHFEEDCKMENVRAFNVIHNIKDLVSHICYFPSNIIDDDETDEIIRKEGFKILFRADCDIDAIRETLMQTVFLKNLELAEIDNDEERIQLEKQQETANVYPTVHKAAENELEVEAQSQLRGQSMISVSVSKLDELMDLVGEMVIAGAMVVQNPDLKGLELNNFQKAARQLNKITSEMQHIVMSIRMVPLTATFHKMNRIVRDMCKKLGKDVQLKIIGAETEVDKNVIEHISDPLMHLVRNALDHGIEPPEDRQSKGKPQTGTITLEAKSAGSDVLVIVNDDGKGLCKEKLLDRARANGLLHKAEVDMSDREIYNLIFLPGFSTKDSISEFSGRGVGMDVVTKNIESVGGTVSVDSIPDKGTTITLKFPLTLAIIDGMNIKVGNSRYTIPTVSIIESFRPQKEAIITDPDGNEMIMVRGQCHPILRLHERYKVKTNITSLFDGIIIMVEQDSKTLCIFADELLGQQQVVVKALPEYVQRFKRIRGLAGCTLLGDGSISLILDIAGLIRV